MEVLCYRSKKVAIRVLEGWGDQKLKIERENLMPMIKIQIQMALFKIPLVKYSSTSFTN